MTSWFHLMPELQSLIIEFVVQGSEFFFCPRSATEYELKRPDLVERYKPYLICLVSRNFLDPEEFTRIVLKTCFVIIREPSHLQILRHTYPRLRSGCSIQLSYFAAEQCIDRRFPYNYYIMLSALNHPLWSVKRVKLDLPSEETWPIVTVNEANTIKLSEMSMRDLYAIMTTEEANNLDMYPRLRDQMRSYVSKPPVETPRDLLEHMLSEVVATQGYMQLEGWDLWLAPLIAKAARGDYELILSFYIQLSSETLDLPPPEPMLVRLSSRDWLIHLEYMGHQFSIGQGLSVKDQCFAADNILPKENVEMCMLM